jgi:tripartite-type tricarboxylate transporter receptor subunit TctC
LVQMLAEPAVKARFEVLGVETASSTPDQLIALMRAEIELWTPIIKAGNIKAD